VVFVICFATVVATVDTYSILFVGSVRGVEETGVDAATKAIGGEHRALVDRVWRERCGVMGGAG